MLTRAVTVEDPQGLHAQLAHRLSALAAGFSASVWIRYGGRRASTADPIQLLALGAETGAEVVVMADGLDEEEAVAAVCNRLGVAD